MRILAEGTEGRVKYKSYWQFGNVIFIDVYDLQDSLLEHVEYKCQYRPIFGIDCADMNACERKLDELIKKYNKEAN